VIGLGGIGLVATDGGRDGGLTFATTTRKRTAQSMGN
jgi:hypothetical protein